MRLMIVGQLEGYISAAGKIALQRGAKVIHCEDIEQALGALRNGKGADVAMVDVKQKIGQFVEALARIERLPVDEQPRRAVHAAAQAAIDIGLDAFVEFAAIEGALQASNIQPA